MFVTQLTLNPQYFQVRSDLSDCCKMHRTIMGAYPYIPEADSDARARLGVLYRIDTNKYTGRITVLIQSKIKPDWKLLPDQYLLGNREESLKIKEVPDVKDVIPSDTKLRFKMRANATKKVTPDKSGNGKRLALFNINDLAEWIAKKGELHGFAVESLSMTQATELFNGRHAPINRTTGKKSRLMHPLNVSDPKKQTLTFFSTVFEGVLRVTDAVKFSEAVESGIGSGKAYGNGLLSIAKV